MSGTYPTTPLGARRISYQALQDVKQVIAWDSSVQCRVLGAHKASYVILHPPGKREEYAALEAFCMLQRGRDESFTWVNPEKATPLGAVSGSPVVYDNYPPRTETIVLDALLPSVPDCFVAGDIVNFGGYTKVHKVAFNADSQPANKLLLEDGFAMLLEDGSYMLLEDAYTVTLTISPPLYKSLTKGQSVNYNNVAYTMKFKNDVQTIKTSAPGIIRKQVELEEYLS